MQYSKSNLGRWEKQHPLAPPFRHSVSTHVRLRVESWLMTRLLSFELASEKMAALIPFSIVSMKTRTWTPRNPSLPNLTLSPSDSGGKAMDSQKNWAREQTDSSRWWLEKGREMFDQKSKVSSSKAENLLNLAQKKAFAWRGGGGWKAISQNSIWTALIAGRCFP